jgi:hypothetical protein
MKHCDSCDASYSDEFRFCPSDGRALRPADECETPHLIPVSAGNAPRSKFHINKWLYVVSAFVIALGAIVLFISSRADQPPDQIVSQPPAIDEAKPKANPAPKRTSASRRRATHAESAASPDEPPNAASELAQQARAQQLVVTGYRRLQQRDYESARAAFEEALEIDPGNSAAQKGLNATQTAASVEGVAGVFRR